MFMNRVHTVTQKHSRVKNPGQKPNWLHEPPTGPASAPGHAQATPRPRACRAPAAHCRAPPRVLPRPTARPAAHCLPRAPTPSAPRAHACRARCLAQPVGSSPSRFCTKIFFFFFSFFFSFLSTTGKIPKKYIYLFSFNFQYTNKFI